MASNTGRTLTGIGCLLWLGCFLLMAVLTIVGSMGLLPDAVASLMSIVQGGSCCCASLGFILGLVGVVMMFTGGNEATE